MHRISGITFWMHRLQLGYQDCTNRRLCHRSCLFVQIIAIKLKTSSLYIDHMWISLLSCLNRINQNIRHPCGVSLYSIQNWVLVRWSGNVSCDHLNIIRKFLTILAFDVCSSIYEKPSLFPS